jgi:cyclic pyranopterin phosphate synthase
MGMVNISEKPVSRRYAEATGKIVLKPETVEKIRKGEIEKGDPLFAAEIAGVSAAKQTHLLIPFCHQIPLDYVRFYFSLKKDSIEVRCSVGAQAKTGVEMEAIVGVSVALNTIWDMVKYLEKDENGQYPYTKIEDIRVLIKQKEEI